MRKLTDLDLEKIYYGWLGKAIGIRYGAPVEMWDAEEIRKRYADAEGYFVDYNDFAADDDSNGPIFFFRALSECKDLSAYGFADMVRCWRNYVPFEHGFYWWGGYGVSEEHTAYLNLQKGIFPPYSGSALQNGRILAEQIGGQIFSDIWGLVSPYDHHRAADLAEIAARVSHDGVAVDGGRFIAALISASFVAGSIREAIGLALETIPRESGYAALVRDLMAFYEKGGKQEACFAYIKERYWKDRYGGNCHIIPNAAIVVYSLLYGEEDFVKTLKIANYSGFDTDCNVGNLGTVMGVFTRLRNVDYATWVAPVRDTTLCSSVIGYANIVNIPNFAYEIFRTALKLRGETYTGKYAESLSIGADDMSLDFALPGSTSGMRGEHAAIANAGGVLEITPEGDGAAYYKTYYGKADLYDNRYDPAFSPKAYRGQTIRAEYTAEEGAQVRIFYEDLHSGKRFCSPPDAREWKIGGEKSILVGKIGLTVAGGKARLKSLSCTGKVDYELNFAEEITEDYSLEHKEVRQCTYYSGVWTLEDGRLTGRCLGDGVLFTGKPLGDCVFETELTPLKGDSFGVIFGAKGAHDHYRAAWADGCLKLTCGASRVLAKKKAAVLAGVPQILKIVCKQNSVAVFLNGKKAMEKKLREDVRGLIGACVGNGSVAAFNRFTVEEI